MADFQTTVELRAQTGQLTQKLNQTNRQLRQVSTQVKKTQGAFTRMGRKVNATFTRMNNKIKEHRAAIAGIGLSLGILVAKGVKDFKEWEDGLAQIATLGVTGIKGIADELDNVRREFGISGAEATKGYYDIISAGAKQGVEAMEQLTAATKLAKAGNTDLAGAIDVVTSGMNIFGDNGETATSLVDQLFLAVKYGKTTVQELGKTFGYVAPVIDAAGLSMADYAASMATITAGGIQTKQATTGLKAVLSNLIKVTPKAAKKAKELGIDFGVAALKSKGLVGVMKDIAEAVDGDVSQLGHLFDSIEAINAVAVLTSGTGLKNLERNFNAMSDSAGTTAEALEIVKKTASYNFGKFNQGLSIMSRSIGAAVIPSLLSMADALGPVVEFMSALITQHPGIIKMTLAVVGLAAALAFLGGPVTLAIVGVVIALKKLSEHFDLFADGGVAALEKIELVWDNFWAGFANKNLSESINQIFSGIGNWIETLLPEGGFVQLWNDTKVKLTDFTTKLTTWFGEEDWAALWNDTLQFVGNIWTGVFSALSFMWTEVTTWYKNTDWKGLWDGTLVFVGNIWTGVSTALTLAWVNISLWFQTADWDSLWSGTLEFAGDIWSGVKYALTAVWTGITDWFATADWKGLWYGTGPHGGGLLEFTGNIWEGIKNALAAAWTGITNWFGEQEWSTLWDNTIQFVGEIWGGVKTVLSTAHESIKDWFSTTDWSGLWDNTLEFTGKVWDGVKNVLDITWTGITSWFSTADWDGLWTGTLSFVGDIWSGVKTGLTSMWTSLTNWFSIQDWDSLWANTLNFVGDVWSGVNTGLTAMWSSLTTWFDNKDWAGLWSDTLNFVGNVWEGVKSSLTTMWSSLTNWFDTQNWTGLWSDTLNFVGNVWTGVKAGLTTMWTSLTNWFSEQNWDGLWSGTLSFVGDVWSGVKSGLTSMWSSLTEWFSIQDWDSLWSGTLNFVGNVWTGIKSTLDTMWTKVTDWFTAADWNGLWDDTLVFAGDIWSGIKTKLTLMWVSLSTWFQLTDWNSLWTGTLEFVGDIWGGVKTALNAMWTSLSDWFTTTDWNSLWTGKGGNPHADGGVLGFIGDIWGGVKAALSTMWDSLTTWFTNADWKGLWTGTLTFAGNVWSGIKIVLDTMWTGLTNWFTNADWSGLWAGTLEFAGDVWTGIKVVLDAAWTSITGWFTTTDWASLWAGTLEFAGDVWTGIKTVLDTMWTSVSNWFTTTDWSTLWDNTLEFSGDVWSSVKTGLDASWVSIQGWFSDLDWTGVGETVRAGMKASFAGIGDIFAGILGEEETVGGDRLAAGATGALATGKIVTKVWPMLQKQFAVLTARIAAYLAPIGASVLSGPVGWVLLGAVAVGGLTYAFWPQIKSFFTDMWDSVTEWFGNLDWSGMWDGLIDSLMNIGSSVVEIVKGWFSNISINPLDWFGGGGDSAEPKLNRYGNEYATGGILKKADGGSVSGEGTGTSDSIPALLSNGEFVMNAKSTKAFLPLLQSMNAKKFAHGGIVGKARSCYAEGGIAKNVDKYAKGGMTQKVEKYAKGGPVVQEVQKYATGGSVGDAKSYQFLQFEEGLFSMSATIDKFIGNMDATDPAVNKVVRQLEYLQKHTGNLNQEQVLQHDYATRINQALINLLPLKKEEAEVTNDAAGAVKDLGDAAKKSADTIVKETNEWEGTAQSFTGPIKQALSSGGDVGDAFKQGIKGMLQRISSKLLDRAFAPLEAGIDKFLNNMLSGSNSMFGGGGGGGGFLSGLFGGGGGGGGRVASSLFGGMMMSRGGIVPKNGMQPQYFAHGGMARGTDTVPAMLTPGEMVLTKEQQQMMGGQQKAGDTYNFNIEATDADSFKRMLSRDPKFLSNIAEQGKQAKSGLRRAR